MFSCVQVEQLQNAVQQKATKLQFLIDVHSNELVENLEEIKDNGLIKYQDKRSDIDRCWTLTVGFRNYAAEVYRNCNSSSYCVVF